ncbi:MAG: sigma-54 dependent transcriptional regulator [Gammaproteobacteria bacterium]|nr:sigma-54 dependent transcriptional regulator [Gammaproteobacteria bacterium]
MTRQRVLIVDDEPDIRELLEITLLRMGLDTRSAEDYVSATRMLEEQAFDLCLTDMKLPDGDGIALVEHIQQQFPHLPTAVITAHGSIDLAIKAMKAGAFDFISKPVSLDTLRSLIDKALTLPSASQQVACSSESSYQIIGETAVMVELKQSIAKFARSQAPVFIQGQSGTGKELVARQIHLQGSREQAPFIAVNCGAIPSELMESEFFGHLKGSFTGATSDNPGLFRAAHGGTLFLDEIADLPLSMQVKLLRVIQEKTVRPVGSQAEQPIDVRIISASHRNLENMVKESVFRQDLYYRVNVIGVRVPPLCERADDIPMLTDYIIKKQNRDSTARISLATEAEQALRKYSFPGNIRELENILERATALCEDDQIKTDDLQLPDIEPACAESDTRLAKMTQDIERDQITRALEASRWNQSAAARSLGITLRQLRYKIEKMSLNKP